MIKYQCRQIYGEKGRQIYGEKEDRFTEKRPRELSCSFLYKSPEGNCVSDTVGGLFQCTFYMCKQADTERAHNVLSCLCIRSLSTHSIEENTELMYGNQILTYY